MDRKAFKQRMQELKSYREQNPGKGYLDWKASKYAEGGEIPPERIEVTDPTTGKKWSEMTEDEKLSWRNARGRNQITGKPIVRGNLEETYPEFDVLTGIRGITNGIKNIGKKTIIKSSTSLSTGADPTLMNRNAAWNARVAEQEKLVKNVANTRQQFNSQLSDTFNSLINSEDAFRRAVMTDKRFGTAYKDTYSKYLRDYNNGKGINAVFDDNIVDGTRAYVNVYDPNTININKTLYPRKGKELEPGLITHEVGHSVDIKSGDGLIKNLGDRKKFIEDDILYQRYPENGEKIKEYLWDGSEIKSHMNEFRNYLMNKGKWSPNETLKSLQKKLYDPSDNGLFDNMRILFDTYKNKKQFLKDYNTIPIVSNNNYNNLV